MNRFQLYVLTLCVYVSGLCSSLLHEDRPSSFPYIAGDTFRAYCDYIYDETGNTVKPDKVKYGDTIFLKTDFLNDFFTNIHPKIQNPYVLVTHNSDYPIPQGYGYMLDDTKLLAWFGQNVEGYQHPKLHPIPIGIANRYWGHGSIEVVSEVQQKTKGWAKPILLYMNFAPSTYLPVRGYVYDLFKNKPFCTVSPPKDFRSYLFDLAQTKFGLSPRGNGLDCHRTWELLYMGASPIVMSSSIDPLFEGLPVLIIKDWNEVTEDFLNAKWEEMSQQTFHLERMYAGYWLEMISSYKKGQAL